jgi:hypothetical protein
MKQLLLIASILFLLGFVIVGCSNNNGKPNTKQMSNKEMYTCTMHNEVISDHAGKCPKCGMTLVKQKMTSAQIQMMKEGTYTKP